MCQERRWNHGKKGFPKLLVNTQKRTYGTWMNQEFFWQVTMDLAGRESKMRVTVAFFVSAAGKKEIKPIVIWKSENPRCLKKLEISK